MRVSVTGLGLGLVLSPPLQRRHPIPCSVQNPTCPGFYLHRCQTRSHPSRFSRRPGLAASGSRGSTPLESPPLPAPGRRCRQSRRPRVLKLPVASSLVPALLSPHPLIPLQTSDQLTLPTALTSTLGPHPFLRGQQVSSEDVVIDTFVSKPQGEGALNEDWAGWVVAGQGALLLRTLDPWCGDTQTWGGGGG